MPATEPAAAPRRLQWMTATVREVIDETPRVRSLVLDVPDWPGHRAGQHVDVRLTAEDGYQAQRSYSIASAPEARSLTLTVERIGEGEVSPYLAGEVRAGDHFELRGPIGGYFVWTPDARRPAVPGRRRLRRGAADGHAAPARGGQKHGAGDAALFLAQLRRHHLPRRAGAAGRAGRRLAASCTR